jgi:hypothetical protein
MSTKRAHDHDYVWIVPKESALGRRLASFTPLGLRVLQREFEKRFVLELTIDETDEANVRNGVYLDFPRYELSFDAHILLLGHFNTLEQLAFQLGSPASPQPE